MSLLDDFRKQHPQYDSIPDGKLASAIRQKYYADMDPSEFYRRSGLTHLVGLDQQPGGITQEEQQPSLTAQFGRSMLRTGKAFGEGITGTLDLLATPFRAGINAVSPDGYKAGTATDLLNSGIQRVTPGMDLEPQGAAERYSDAITRGVGGAATGMGIGGGLAASASPVASAVGRGLLANPGGQLLATTTGSTGSQVAKDAGFGPLGQFAAGIGGALAPTAIGAGVLGAKNAVGAMMAPGAEQQALAQAALQRGIPLKASQVNGGQFGKYLDSVTGIVPGSGAKAFDNAQREAFNRAVGRTIGADPAASKITETVFANAKRDVSNTYDDLWNRNSLNFTPQLQQDFQGTIANAASAKPEILSKIQGYWSRITNGIQQDANGNIVLPGSRFKQIDTDMGRDAISSDPEVRHYIGQLQDGLRQAMGQSMNAQDQALLGQANQRWGAIKTLAPVVAKATTGDVSPSLLQSAVTNNASSKMAMATGSRGELGTLARIGQGLLKEPPQSGTEPRMMVRNFLGGIGSLGGALAGGSVLGATGTALTGAGVVGGSRIVQGLLRDPSIVGRAAGMPVATPNYLNQLPWLATQQPSYSLLQGPQPPR